MSNELCPVCETNKLSLMSSENLADGKICANCLSRLGLVAGTTGNSVLLKRITIDKAKELLANSQMLAISASQSQQQANISSIEIPIEPKVSVAIPDEIKGWNWGAFSFNWIWGIANKTYLPLLALIPFFNIVWIFIVGAKGNEWAWRDGNYKDIDTFKAVQKTWNRAGLVQFIVLMIILAFYALFFAAIISSFVNSYNAYSSYGY